MTDDDERELIQYRRVLELGAEIAAEDDDASDAGREPRDERLRKLAEVLTGDEEETPDEESDHGRTPGGKDAGAHP